GADASRPDARRRRDRRRRRGPRLRPRRVGPHLRRGRHTRRAPRLGRRRRRDSADIEPVLAAYRVGVRLGRMFAMGPFDLPPSTPPVSFEPPEPHRTARRSRSRTVAVIAASVALVAAGVLAVALFASNDDSPTANAAQEAGTTPPTPAP